MPLLSIQAIAHPDGNRVDLSWQYNAVETFDGLRIVRREGRYPQYPDDGVIVADIVIATNSETVVQDTKLCAEKYVYYGFFLFVGDPPTYNYEQQNRAAALVTAPHGYASYMQDMLPAIYHRYDKNTQFLTRFSTLIGGQVDQFQSFANFSLALRKLDSTPGPILPLLAQWVAWKTDNKRDFDSQRNEINNAPDIYRRIGLLPTVEATIKRISGWESQSKEYVHNIFSSNRPPRLNLWSLSRDAGGFWTEDETLQSLDYCYEGRPATTSDAEGIRWLFYHTQRKGRWEIWSKTTPSYQLKTDLQSELVNGVISAELWQSLTDAGLLLAQTAVINTLSSNIWEINDGPMRVVVEQTLSALLVYDNNSEETAYSPSEAQIVNTSINKYPSTVLQASTLWLFWTVYDLANASWQINYRRRNNALWSEIGPQITDTEATNPFMEGGLFDADRKRRRAFAVTDDSNNLWLFWQEYVNDRWQLRYNRHDGLTWDTAIMFPLDGADEPQVQDDIMVLLTPSIPTPLIYVFWARQQAIFSSGEDRWHIVVRLKNDQVFNNNNWSPIHILPKGISDNFHDREPYALINAAAELELFFASNRNDSGWSIWRTTLLDISTDNWSASERISSERYSQRAPLALQGSENVTLFYRNNRNIIYNSDVYRASNSYDERYAGSTTIDVRHQQQVLLHNQFEDPQRYTYDTGTLGQRNDNNKIARDTIGAFVNPQTMDEADIATDIERLRSVLREFMPITDRAVFIAQTSTQTEYVYSYDLVGADDAHFIGSSYSDEWVSTAEVVVLPPGEDFDSLLET